MAAPVAHRSSCYINVSLSVSCILYFFIVLHSVNTLMPQNYKKVLEYTKNSVKKLSFRVKGQVRDPQLPMHHPLGTGIDISPPIAKNHGCCLTLRLLIAFFDRRRVVEVI